MVTARRGQARGQRRETPRRGAVPRPIPGGAASDPRQDDDFQKWNAQYGPGTVPEYQVFRWLEKQGFRHGIEFTYQVPFDGGRQVYGAQVADFEVMQWLAWFVNGVYWHYQRDPMQRLRDQLNYERLESLGLTVVVLLDTDIAARIDQVCSLAMQGLEEPGAREGSSSAA